MNDSMIKRQGVVTSDKPEKKCVVRVTRSVMHPIYMKRVKKSKKFMVHDEKNDANIGDTVEFIDCRPLTKRCSHRLVAIINRASKAEVL
ncbi:MAG: 30S ribosomal protein S17 [Caldisericia bacterium]|nr:30S ribosomal protein S17 [Caldisericia bacterium]